MDATERILELHELAEPAQIIVGMIRQAERYVARMRTIVENRLNLAGQLDDDSAKRFGPQLKSLEIDPAIVKIAQNQIDWTIGEIETVRVLLQGRDQNLYEALSSGKESVLRAATVLPWGRREAQPLFEALREAQNELHSAAENIAAIVDLNKSTTTGSATQLVDPPREIGWTASSLRKQVKARSGETLSGSTLRRIRKAAKVTPRTNAHDRFDWDEVKKMIQVAANGSPLWQACAKAWRAMLIECRKDALSLSRQ